MREEAIGGDNSLGAIRSHLLMASVMEQDYVAATDLPRHLSFDYCRRWRVPVVASHVPHDGLQAEFVGDAQHRGTATSKGWAKEIGMIARRILQRGLTVG